MESDSVNDETAVPVINPQASQLRASNRPRKRKSFDDEIPPARLHVSPSKMPVKVEPTVAKVNRPEDLAAKAQYRPGYLVWAKISGHPWWPCIVISDPNTGIFVKQVVNRFIHQYHIMFLGERVDHAWVLSSFLLDYCSVDDLKAQFHVLYSKNSRTAKRYILQVGGHIENEWLKSVDYAREALEMDLDERINHYKNYFVKDHVKAPQVSEEPKNKGKKRKTTVEEKSTKKSKLEDELQAATETVDDEVSSMEDYASSSATEGSELVIDMPVEKKKVRKVYTKRKKIANGERNTKTKTSGVLRDDKAEENDVKPEDHLSCFNSETEMVKVKRKYTKKVKNDSDTPQEQGESEKLNTLVWRHQSDFPEASELEFELMTFKLSVTPVRNVKDEVCHVCEEYDGTEILCTGLCRRSFHQHCLDIGTISNTENWKCVECHSKSYVCFSCKSSEGEVLACKSLCSCGRFFHLECVKKLCNVSVKNDGFVCPSHTCATCSFERERTAGKGKLYKCLRCPIAYHATDVCIAAGSQVIAGTSWIVCSDHFTPKRGQAHHDHINVAWCFLCSKGGTLLCCESCPASFHAQCMNIPFPEGSWSCANCLAGKRTLYGEIVWCKVGVYRWWPAEICHPRHVPSNIREKPHGTGEFPVHFFGSNDFYWSHHARVFQYQEGDKNSRHSIGRNNLGKFFRKAILNADIAFRVREKALENRQNEQNDKRPAYYKHVKGNIALGGVQIYKADISTLTRCECSASAPCTSESDCLNRILMYECHPALCPAKDFCKNQRFQRRQYPQVKPFKTKSGWGLCLLEDIKKGTFVHEYVGDLVDEEECKKRIEQAHQNNITNFYMLTLDRNRIIDAGPKGNYSRFMNHSCNPNCETQKWTVNGDCRIGLFALCDINAGSELTFNYNLECLGNGKTVCHCNSANCSGFLGVRPKQNEILTAGDKKRKKKRRKKNKDEGSELDDGCYRCGEGGYLVMCDRPRCKKGYHADCLNLSKAPYGRWECPWHHCDVCGHPATLLCTLCPNSFCSKHFASNIVLNAQQKLICHDEADFVKFLGPASFDVLLPKPGNAAQSHKARTLAIAREVSTDSSLISESTDDESLPLKSKHADKKKGTIKKGRITKNENKDDETWKQSNGLSLKGTTNVDKGRTETEGTVGSSCEKIRI